MAAAGDAGAGRDEGGEVVGVAAVLGCDRAEQLVEVVVVAVAQSGVVAWIVVAGTVTSMVPAADTGAAAGGRRCGARWRMPVGMSCRDCV